MAKHITYISGSKLPYHILSEIRGGISNLCCLNAFVFPGHMLSSRNAERGILKAP
jgi:hypothetical protein